MMMEMRQNGAKEKQQEIITFQSFSSWCTNTEKNKVKCVNNGELKMGQLSADIDKFEEDAKVLSEDVAALDRNMDENEADKKTAQVAREEDHQQYVRRVTEMEASISQAAQAAQLVKSMMSKTEGGASSASAASFLQQFVSNGALLDHERSVLAAFLATGSTMYGPTPAPNLEVEAPEAAAFESKSGGLVDLMEGLQDRLQQQKKRTDEEEAEAVHATMTDLQSLTDQNENSADIRSRKASTMKQREMDAATAKSDLGATTATRDSDQKYTDDLRIECKQKHEDFAARQKLRGEELEAFDKAIEIIGGGDVSGAADKHLPALLQNKSKRPSLAQLRSEGAATKHDAQQAAAAFLDLQGKKFNSHMLAALATRVTQDPFGKVKKMIEGMVQKLMQEATDEAEHKGFCDTELSTNGQTRQIKTDKVDELKSRIEEQTARTTLLSQEITRLSEDITALDAAVAKATEMRQAEKEKNAATLSEAQIAIAAMEKATGVLKEFYAKAAGATALSQLERAGGVADEAPQTFDKPYQGQDSDGQGGILGMLDVILSDFQRLEAATTAGEINSETDFDRFTADSSKDKAVKNAESSHKSDEVAKLDADISEAKTDLASTQEELDAATAYFEKLKPSCIDTNASYEDRVARRKEEIESLHEALDILSSE